MKCGIDFVGDRVSRMREVGFSDFVANSISNGDVWRKFFVVTHQQRILKLNFVKVLVNISKRRLRFSGFRRSSQL
jgi:hypothetical protein